MQVKHWSGSQALIACKRPSILVFSYWELLKIHNFIA